MSSLYIGGINPLAVTLFANVFFHLVGCLFALLMVSFAVQKLLILVRSCLFIFAFISFALGDRFKKYCYDLCKSVLPMLSSRSFIVFSGGSDVKNLPEMWESWVHSLGWEDPLEESMATHSSIFAWRIPMGRGAWRATAHGVKKSWP